MSILAVIIIIFLATGFGVFRFSLLKRARERRRTAVNVREFNNRRRIAAAMDRKIESRIAEKKAGMLSLETPEAGQGQLSIKKNRNKK